ncbi:signaling threshold-regulating transmembrane adapter 1 [Carettochelys insculpta]|uniref:signaling threshold-regulating transmembrane adapter 1 n=1 Tax=Carettochelys insculpta TaxID=44489 RepID=UPI003EBBF0F5
MTWSGSLARAYAMRCLGARFALLVLELELEGSTRLSGKPPPGQGFLQAVLAQCSMQSLCFAGHGAVQGTDAMWGLFGALVLSHLVSLLWNVLCCMRHMAQQDESRRLVPQFSRRVKHVTEEIPVYGNISYLQTGHSSGFESSATPEFPEERESSHKKPTCYANLKTLKPQGRQQPEPSVGGTEIQYTDVVVMEPRWSEPEIWGWGVLKGREAPQLQSELYASVHADRYTAKFENKAYANNHALPS